MKILSANHSLPLQYKSAPTRSLKETPSLSQGKTLSQTRDQANIKFQRKVFSGVMGVTAVGIAFTGANVASKLSGGSMLGAAAGGLGFAAVAGAALAVGTGGITGQEPKGYLIGSALAGGVLGAVKTKSIVGGLVGAGLGASAGALAIAASGD